MLHRDEEFPAVQQLLRDDYLNTYTAMLIGLFISNEPISVRRFYQVYEYHEVVKVRQDSWKVRVLDYLADKVNSELEGEPMNIEAIVGLTLAAVYLCEGETGKDRWKEIIQGMRCPY